LDKLFTVFTLIDINYSRAGIAALLRKGKVSGPKGHLSGRAAKTARAWLNAPGNFQCKIGFNNAQTTEPLPAFRIAVSGTDQGLV
jgi:hypothetical protein